MSCRRENGGRERHKNTREGKNQKTVIWRSTEDVQVLYDYCNVTISSSIKSATPNKLIIICRLSPRGDRVIVILVLGCKTDEDSWSYLVVIEEKELYQ